MSSARYRRRLLVNRFNLAMSLATMAFGMLFLLWILAMLFMQRRRRAVADAVHADDAAAGVGGRLANAIFGSAADRRRPRRSSARRSASWPASTSPSTARNGWLAEATRFINDILLSAPSIVIGLFVYTVYVAQVGHFSGWAGSLALALIAIPVVVRTTENMLQLVPSSLREAAVALGAPKWKVILMVTLKAVRGGVITGMLLAVARIAGETAPLLFTALNNQFWSPT